MALHLSRAASAGAGESSVRLMMRAQQLEREGRDIVHLDIGEPDFSTPEHVTRAGIAALEAHATHYAPVPGLGELRDAVAASTTAFRSLPVAYTREHVIIGPGAKPLLWNLMAVMLDPGDEVVYADPAYPAYPAACAYLGAHAKTFALREDRAWSPDLDELAHAITPRTKVIILNSPNNPTGGTIPREDLARIADLVLEHDMLVISDEIYSRNVYDEAFSSIVQLPGMQERTVIVDGVSKSHAMTGWRLGYCIAPPEIVRAMTTFANNTYQCTATFTQFAGIAALTGDDAPTVAMNERLRARRDVVVARLNAMPGVRCEVPRGAFYAFPNVSAIEPDDLALANYLLEAAGVACLSGSSFGPAGAGYLRLSYATSTANLEKAMDRIAAALADYSPN
jgi:aspartate aminotransferase